MTADAKLTGKTIPTNLRLLILLEELARVGTPITPTTVNEVLGLPKPTIHRLFQTLEQEGFIERDIDGRSFAPGARLRKLAGWVLSTSSVRTLRLNVLNELVREIGETCNIVVPERDGMVSIDRVITKWPLRIQLPLGSRAPFHCTAAGKLYLSTLSPRLFSKYINTVELKAHTSHTQTNTEELSAEIEKIRVQGYATNNQEYMEGLVAIAVPLLDGEKRLISTLSVHAPIQRFDLEGLVAHMPKLKSAAAVLAELVV